MAFTDFQDDAGKYSSTTAMMADKLPNLVKGAGFIRGNKPLDNDAEVFERSAKAQQSIVTATRNGFSNGPSIVKGLSSEFTTQFGMFTAGLGMFAPQFGPGGISMLVNELQSKGIVDADFARNFTTTSPLSTGLVPFDLVAPSRLLYPMFSPLRNKFPRVQGQGTSRRSKSLLGVQGTSTPSGSNGFKRVSQTELPGGGSLSSWPTQLPASGSQSANDLTVPYKFFGISEALTWLAQFSGQGFEDISALANLILMHEAMLGEEAQLLCGTGTAITAPTASLAARSAGSNETALSGITTNVFVKVTAVTLFGETQVGAQASVGWSSGQVVDVTIAPVRGALSYNIYVTTGASAGTYYLMQSNVGAKKFTLQGAIPTSGTAVPGADTSYSTSDYEGLLSILSDHAATDASVYPAGFKGGYINQSVGDTLNTNVVNAALSGLWGGVGGYRANPSELICEGSDAKRFSDDILIQNSQSGAYQFFINQNEIGNIVGGAAISQFTNPITRDLVRILVHPWLLQGTAMLMQYNLPMTYANLSNVWEVVNVQDYISIAWPVIDASFRYSIMWYGALVGNAPMYCGLLQGLQQSTSTPYS